MANLRNELALHVFNSFTFGFIQADLYEGFSPVQQGLLRMHLNVIKTPIFAPVGSMVHGLFRFAEFQGLQNLSQLHLRKLRSHFKHRQTLQFVLRVAKIPPGTLIGLQNAQV